VSDHDLPPDEPSYEPWVEVPVSDVAAQLVDRAGEPFGRARVIAVDGRSSSGKSTFAGQLAACLPRAIVVHTDDIAWHHSFFGWDSVMVEGVLEPVHRGEPVAFRPAAWADREREGSIDVPVGTRTVIIEGVGAARRELMPYLDAVVWVQSGLRASRMRGIARDGGDAAATEFWDQWMAAEFPFQADQRPWERADVVVSGSASRHQPNSVRISLVSPAG
jgi:hypothetical protein